LARHLAPLAMVESSAATISAMASCRTMTMASGEEAAAPVAEAEAGAVCSPVPTASKWKNEEAIVHCKEM
jgi:hypothetical protein